MSLQPLSETFFVSFVFFHVFERSRLNMTVYIYLYCIPIYLSIYIHTIYNCILNTRKI